jgi:hypothetical protein
MRAIPVAASIMKEHSFEMCVASDFPLVEEVLIPFGHKLKH